MTTSKTKAQLVDVARQLFAKKGVEATTMNDIAVASQKGRRTLYTYFKSKEEVYMAVVESELEMLSDRMTRAAERPTSPEKKILELIMTHLDAIKLVVFRNGTLRAYFFRNIWQVETIRKHFDQKPAAIQKAGIVSHCPHENPGGVRSYALLRFRPQIVGGGGMLRLAVRDRGGNQTDGENGVSHKEQKGIGLLIRSFSGLEPPFRSEPPDQLLLVPAGL